MDKKILGFDLGGTNLHIAYLANGSVRQLGVFPFRHADTFDREMELLCQAALSLGVPFDRLHLATAGFVDSRNGSVITSVNFPGIVGPVRQSLSERLRVPVALLNDGDAAAIGLCRQHRVSSCLAITLGTGVGIGIASLGSPMLGCRGISPDLGHMVVTGSLSSQTRCGCGSFRCIEAFWGAASLRDQFREFSDLTSIKRIDIGDPRAEILINQLVLLIRNCSLSYQPQQVMITGGTSAIASEWIDEIRARVKAELSGPLKIFCPDNVTIVESDRNIAAYGACHYQ